MGGDLTRGEGGMFRRKKNKKKGGGEGGRDLMRGEEGNIERFRG